MSALDFQPDTLRMGAMGYLGKPVTAQNVRGALEHIESIVSRKARNLLIIEDDARQREAITSFIQGKDLRIVGATLGNEAFGTYEK